MCRGIEVILFVHPIINYGVLIIHMRILISNDDGQTAKGIEVLTERLRELGQVTIVAPDRNRSGASNSLTLDIPIRIHQVSENVHALSGTPTDCVHIALTSMMDERPDVVVSGINQGPNLGDDVIYSGTVAAALEGRILGLPAIAISLVCDEHNQKHFDTAAEVASRLVKRLLKNPLPADTILNVNVPDLPWEEIKGLQVTRLGHRHRDNPCIPAQDPQGRPLYWILPATEEEDGGPGTDFHAIRHRYVSITPMHVDLTRHRALDPLADWVDAIGFHD